MLLEESIVVVDNDPTIISSIVLGLELLLRPFKWPYIMIPVLPSTLIDILDAPQSLLLGLTGADFEKLE